MTEQPIAVTQGDEDSAQDMLNHAFRHVGVRALKDVKFADIAQAFARHRLAERERCAKVAEDFEGSASLERADDPCSAVGQEIATTIRSSSDAE